MNGNNDTEIPKPAEPVSSGGSITGLLKVADESLRNPIISGMIKTHPKEVKGLISDYAGEYEGIIYGYLKTSYPDIHEALSSVQEEERDRGTDTGTDTSMIPHRKFADDVLDLDDEGYSLNQIAEILTDKYNKKVYPMQVSRIIKKAEEDEAQEAQPQPKPKGNVIDLIADVVAKRIDKPAHVLAPVSVGKPDASMLKALEALNTFNRIVTVGKWIGLSLISGIIGIAIGKVIL